ncbi:MAG: NgoFVII family restriction endonuclease [Alloprevotella sp.]|nr:NgoFVII family restriction endonuclease [Alloprevotella sp.]
MPEHHFRNLKDFLTGWKDNQKYFDMLQLMAQLSRLFSENDVPYLDYRLAENLFCRYYSAINDARSCTAYDARIESVGIGIKTFILNKNNASTEKIAEFNKLKTELAGLKGKDLARRLGDFRNDRMSFANNAFDVKETQYHIVGRREGLLRVFNCPYEEIDVERIHVEKDDATSILFEDERNSYAFNKSKSVLMKSFEVSGDYKDIAVDIVDEPLVLLEEFFQQYNSRIEETKKFIKGIDYVVLPLYSVRTGRVPDKSGLNQWNASGRKRDEDEVYIPIPIAIHRNYPQFFPDRDTPFSLQLPDGKVLSAKVCSDNGKALMSNPNKELGRWLLRKVLKKEPRTLVSWEDFNRYGFDSVCVENLHRTNSNGEREYKIYFTASAGGYSDFIRV